MIFTETKLAGAYVIEPEKHEDERGFFARTWCHESFQQKGLNHLFVQCNISYNAKKGTLRGMHYQKEPHAEVKLVRCTLGSVFDVMIDLRPESNTFHQWFGIELSAKNRLALYIPKHMAHGFISLEDASEVFYQMSSHYYPESSAAVRWNDPRFAIKWPIDVSTLSNKDKNTPYLDKGSL